MSRWLTILAALVMLAFGVVFSALNDTAASLDLYFLTISLPIGVLALACVFLGCLLGGAFLYAGVIVPLRLRLRAQRKQLEQYAKADAANRSAGSLGTNTAMSPAGSAVTMTSPLGAGASAATVPGAAVVTRTGVA